MVGCWLSTCCVTPDCVRRLRLIAPVNKDHGIDYERGKLQDKLNEGSLTLERTQASCGAIHDHATLLVLTFNG